ncbi:hypothetical protein [Eubacterium sp. AB3007]|uniref:hypothetical protein n=1 Tax=Eubacterium sp. AB3007 TaxID=1392487 RepID=UPI00047FCA9F|nr:hypothetical protein [Eubacterium sp. AB3007]
MTLDEINRQKHAALVERKGLCEHLLAELPQGCMVVSRKKGRDYYSIDQKGKRLALKRDDPLVTKLCDRKLVERVLAGIDQAIIEIEKGKQCRAVFDPNELIQLLPKAYRTPSSEVFREMGFEDARSWATAPV